MARGRSNAPGRKELDPKLEREFKSLAEKRGGRVIEQGKIHSWADVDPGFILEGDFVLLREGAARSDGMAPGHLLVVVNADNGETETWGCPAILRYRIEEGMPKKGDSIRIMYAGKVPSKKAGRSDSHDFRVAIFEK